MPQPLPTPRMLSILVPGLLAASAAARVVIPTVPIGNPGNAPGVSVNDPLVSHGGVAYIYSIGTTEVTNEQYAAFLNAVAAVDTHGLYDAGMAEIRGGILRSGTSGSYIYSTAPGRQNNPVNWVDFWDAARFANWLHNGQPSGPQSPSTTEDGAYTLTPAGISGNSVSRNAAATWALPSEDEWYKAAYHQPAAQGGDADDYWLYPTSRNLVLGNEMNVADVIGNTRPVASYAPNFYGTFDMGGNVWEWTDARGFNPEDRLIYGGGFDSSAFQPYSDGWLTFPAENYDSSTGFRVVNIPGPVPAALLVIAAMLSSRRRARTVRARPGR